MKILVLSDSHASLQYMRRCMEKIRPDVAIHLGDYFEDGEVLREEYPGVRLIQVPGNCDRHRLLTRQPEILQETIGGVKFYLTHGHLHNVKLSVYSLLRDARASHADVVLYGHTHVKECYREDGLWIMNPGTCGYYGGSAGLIIVENGQVQDCQLIS